MNAKRLTASLVAGLCMIGMAGVALAADKTTVEVNFWNPNLDAKAKVTSGNTGTEVNFKNDLGMTDKNLTDFRLTWGDKHKTRVAYTDFDYSANKILSQAIDFNGQHYNVNDTVASKMDIKYYRVGFLNRISSNAKTNVDFLFELKGFTFDTMLQNSLTSASKKFSGVLPTFGLAASTQLDPKVSLYGEISGLPLGSHGYVYDFETGLTYELARNVSLAAGYRVFDLKAKSNDDFARIKLNGPYFRLAYNF